MRKSGLILTLAVALAAGCGHDAPAPVATPTPVACATGTPVAGTPPLTATLVAGGFETPLDLQAPPGDRERVFVVEQVGVIKIVRAGTVLATPFLDIHTKTRPGGEQGLLGLAFHPQYATNHRFYVNYTDRPGDTHISEFQSSSTNPDFADPATERELLYLHQPFANHNGGGLAFGGDGMLYVGLGDGGSGGDPFGNGQNLKTPLGKMLRYDVDRAVPPPDNPFLNTPGAFPYIWAYGLRNPFRFAFDRVTGDLYIGDVGQNLHEEVDVALAPRRGGENYGWNIMEGLSCYAPSSGCNQAGLTLPVLDYGHDQGCAIIGGVVYRGCLMPGYAGAYFYGDECSAFVRSFRLQGGKVTDERDWTASVGKGLQNISSFGVDADGEVYIVEYAGRLFKIVPAS
ncbi:MAG TPA: PQQ-dependent sugar dehydrogenase [Vicinamibacteria bacterium]|nr:PQQ-dependent sugar dehydrogenase [Vicinamibacteria bacterium]